MKARSKVFLKIVFLQTLVAILIPAIAAFAQEGSYSSAITSLTFFIIIGMAMYAYLSFSVQIIARKTGTPNDWFAWIPVANIFLLLAVAKKPLWWFFLLFVPFVNVVMLIIVWMRIAENVGKPSWLGLLTLIPLVGFILPGYLAWSE